MPVGLVGLAGMRPKARRGNGSRAVIGARLLPLLPIPRGW